jgi:alanine racemase
MNLSWAEIHRPVLRRNVRAIRACLPPETVLIAMVKSDAYGHGLSLVAPTLRSEGVRHFGVFTLEEAARLRSFVPDADILLVGPADDAQVPDMLDLRVIPLLITLEQARGLSRAAERLGGRLKCHVKFDTGMGRIGFPWEEAPTVAAVLSRLPGLALTGACTHYAAAGAADAAFTRLQAQRFRAAIAACRATGLAIPFLHAAASDALCFDREWQYTGVRPGILLYGYGPVGPARCPTRPFLQWRTRLIQVKRVPAGTPVSYDCTYRAPAETVIGTFPVGYADGYFRQWSNRAPVLVGGRRGHVAGRVTMNLTMVDLGPDSTARPGDVVTLLGEDGSESVWADELATLAGTISYEVLTSIRSPRMPVDSPDEERPERDQGPR